MYNTPLPCQSPDGTRDFCYHDTFINPLSGTPMRRLPVFLVIDISESMAGDNLRHMQEGINRLVSVLRTDPHALETVHLSVIAFAGVARTIAPLVELFAFYPPRLPVGSGTSIGAALEHLMNEIRTQVVANSPTQKGDYKPVVYFMSDGKATDNPASAIARWQREFAKRATLVSIGIGPYADLSLLSQISAQTLSRRKAKAWAWTYRSPSTKPKIRRCRWSKTRWTRQRWTKTTSSSPACARKPACPT